ncbi:MAG: type VI secretion system contractile sheath large subunit [Holosporales bacterium]
MRESLQHMLDHVRPPRVQITYDVEIGGAVESRELPFVMGVIADLSADSETPRLAIKDRKFVDISSDTMGDVMASIRPKLNLSVADRISGGDKSLGLSLTFTTIDDFEPLRIIAQVSSLKALYDARTRLSDLISKLDGNESLNKAFDEVLNAKDKKAKKAEDIVKDTNLVRDASQAEYATALVNEFLTNVAGGASVPNDAIAAVSQRIAQLDAVINAQLNEILHHPAFLKLEGSWRGLNYLLSSTDQSEKIRIRLFNISKAELQFDLERAVEFDQSQLFKKVYEEEYGTFGGSPYSCLMGDFEFGRNPQDIALLTKISQVAAAAHAPFVAAAAPTLFDLDSFVNLGVPRDLSRVFQNTELGKWQAFRETEDSRYVALTLPHVLMRAPYGEQGVMVAGLNFEEDVDGADNSRFCWGSAAWALAQRIITSATLYGWPASIRGVEGGGLVEDLPYYTFKTTDGDVALKCPTEVAITDRREKELSDLGFIALCHCKNRDYAAFFGSQTTQKPKVYNLDEANANARLSARLSYILAASRFAHYIKVIMRDKVGSFMSRIEVERYLNNWIAQYVLLTDDAGPSSKARFPLREARVDVADVPGMPGSYRAAVFLRPHFQLEELTASIRLVANLPRPAAR